ncbi:hypothetical protein HET69_31275 [Streptomyces sp. CJ_13]|uniref:hypothetical protein n=1 Tax=Streptomyces TaxID=1883 RepID=UPI001BDD1918|nr:hypothetical protein [Streptomyces sp. CJ_13]MBT1188339.1 hypothetical protein [Streptomyces sp. CJ_13]
MSAAKVSLLAFELSWWIVGPVAVLAGVIGAFAGARAGWMEGVREEALEPGEVVLSAYPVRPLFEDGRATGPSDSARFELRVTTLGLQLWEGTGRLWSHPWRAVRLTAEGDFVLVHHGDREIAELLVDTFDGSPDELLLGAERLRARAQHTHP